ncbi:MAG: DUF1674 domain-containing protein [Rhodobacteraceae bacterium]|nr:DUF1674 domain-containing protein [Paracoccaceae bacterium]
MLHGKNKKNLSAAAKRSLLEAEERQKIAKKKILPKELGGRNGLEPTRYGDWEKKGIVSDF